MLFPRQVMADEDVEFPSSYVPHSSTQPVFNNYGKVDEICETPLIRDCEGWHYNL